MMHLQFKKEGYDPFISYLKGVCIFWVILTHTITKDVHDYSLFCLWGDMAVPIFLAIQCVHVYKKESKPNNPDLRKLWRRIIKPFLYVQALLYLLGAICSVLINYYDNFWNFTYSFLIEGGWGKGGYYPKMYLEFAFLIPLFYPVLNHKNKFMGGVVICICVISEIVFSYIDYYKLWQWVCFRYLFLIYLGFYVSRWGIILNSKTFFLSLISISLILLFQYSDIDYQPFFYNNPWRIFHWPVYFYTIFLLIPMVKLVYNIKCQPINDVFELMGKYSYEIFLFQMIVFFVSDRGMESVLTKYLGVPSLLYSFMLVVVSVCPVIAYKSLKTRNNGPV